MSYGGGFGTVGGFLERFLGHDREEKGMPPQTAAPATTENAERGGHHSLVPKFMTGKRHLGVSRTDASSLIPQDDKLLMFRALTGIDTVPALTGSGHSARSAPNIGIYTRVVNAEKAAQKGFRFYSHLINVFLGTQIIVAAILTALGAANGPHAAVTAFGAINTIIAGAMTYLKGSGLPNVLRHHENEWRVVREFIEQREREFCLVDCTLDVNEELLTVEEMYKRTKMDLEAGASGGTFKSGQNDVPRAVMAKPPPSDTTSRNLEVSEKPEQSEKLDDSERPQASSPATTADRL